MIAPLPGFHLDGRHALVCGGGSGIGRAAAVALAQTGARITALARTQSNLAQLIDELKDMGADQPAYVVADYDDRAELEQKVRHLLMERGPVHVLVHNTGGPPGGPLLDAQDSLLDQYFARNVLVGQMLVRTLLPGMVADGYGRIITVLSTSVKEPIDNLGVGNTVRGAMSAWMKTLANELPPGITINNVLPGFTATERLTSLAQARALREGKSIADIEAIWRGQIPEGRLGRPEEIGAMIAFLASGAASYVRGQNIAVDGGRLRGL